MISAFLLLDNMLCLSLSALRYSFVHLDHAASLHLLIQCCCLFIFGISSCRSSFGSNSGCPYNNVFGVKTGIWISSSANIKIWLFSVTSMSKTIYSNSFWIRLALSVVLYKQVPKFIFRAPPSTRFLYLTIEFYLN